jgi:carbon storage regulator
MLCLSRKKGESVVIAGGIRVVIRGVFGGTVQLGIEAPPHVGIYRHEVFERMQLEPTEAAVAGGVRRVPREPHAATDSVGEGSGLSAGGSPTSTAKDG